MKTRKKRLSSLLYTGISEDDLVELEGRSKLVTNYFLLYGIFMILMMLIISLVFKIWRIALQYVALTVVFSIIFSLLRGKIVTHLVAKTICFVAVIGNTVVISLYWGRDAGCNLLILVLSILAYLAYTSRERLLRNIIVAACISLFFALEAYFILYGTKYPKIPITPFIFTVGGTLILLVACLRYFSKTIYEGEQLLQREKLKTERLLENILPKKVILRLKARPRLTADMYQEATVLFADIVGFTKRSEKLSPMKLVRGLNAIYTVLDELIGHYGAEKIKTIGDAYMIVTGAPERRADHLQLMADISLAMCALISSRTLSLGNQPIQLRIGMHTGPLVAGVIGKAKYSYDLWGDTVNIAARMESCAEPGRIHTTEAVHRKLMKEYDFERRGKIDVKGKGKMQTYYLCGKKARITNR